MTDSSKNIIDRQVVENLRELNPDDPNFLRELIDLFLEDFPARVDEIERALATKDAVLLTRAAHTIKGSSGNFGAASLSRVAMEMEQQGKSSSFDAAAASLVSLRAEFALVAAALRELT
ncbi:MAG: Hpt domain-containing protein [Oleiharenicola lentus]